MPDSVLVTGGAGFTGSHIVVELARSGYAPVVLDSFANSTPAVRSRLEALAGRPVPCVTADVRDVGALRNAFHDHPIAAVVHCAALENVAESQARPLAFYDVNVGGTLSLIEVMGEAGVGTLVYASSASVYGDTDVEPAGEHAPLAPANVHGRTKRVVEDFLRDLTAANANWRIAIVRKFNVAGAHSSGMMGEAARARSAHLIPQLCRVAAGEASEFLVCGDDWDTPDGTGVRDYVHVQDAAALFARALAHIASRPGIFTLNAGTGASHSVLSVLAAFERACGRAIARTISGRRPGDVAFACADVSRASSVLDWRPTRDIDAICADAWRWQKIGGRY
ncbi:MAG TPA: UDP-glucose 4-epimerase GalE [Casimicrobiaceae bacterium]|nr:UDP-glucose 4-epimerase GalE [Casimicrobiaceae bacterium]